MVRPPGASILRGWIANCIEAIEPILGGPIGSVMLGQGEMSIEGRPTGIWTRILIRVEVGWLEIFNALDANGYAFHSERPEGSLIRCLGPP